nr:MAG TPA: hypothetical protein [Caudoviricetes sp.]
MYIKDHIKMMFLLHFYHKFHLEEVYILQLMHYFSQL